MGHLRHLSLPQQVEWQTNVTDIIADWLNLYQPRKESPRYAAIIAWIRTEVLFAILRGALLCLRGSRTLQRHQFPNIRNNDLELENDLAGLS